MGERVVIGGHTIDRSDRTQRAGKVIGPVVAHDPNGAHWQDRHEGLPDFVVEPVLADLVDIDRVRLAQDVELFAGDFTWATDRKAGARERVTSDKRCGQAKFNAQGAHFVFEEFAQGFDQFEAHLFG